MVAWRFMQRIGGVILPLAILFAIVDKRVRPGRGDLLIPVMIALALGLAVGLAARSKWSLSRRLTFLHALSPRLARRVLPPPPEDPPSPERQ
jgi:hypothetical protein